MSFNNGNERRKLNAKWEHLRVQYREAGMSEDAIQAMYEFDLGVLNSERAYITNTLTVSDTTDDSTATETSDFKQYEKAITVTDTYHETKTRFAWVGFRCPAWAAFEARLRPRKNTSPRHPGAALKQR